MRITDALRGEHGVLYSTFDHLATEMAAGKDLSGYAALLRKVLREHARIEDDLLFDELAEQMGGGGGPASAMIEEHRRIAELLGRSADAREDELPNLLEEVIELARSHFRREEEAAFPMAEQLLDAERLHRLGAEWSERRDVRSGGAHVG